MEPDFSTPSRVQHVEQQLHERTMSELIQQVGEWSRLNFAEKQAPLFGVVEEIGEACHGILKRIQKIRGMDKSGTFYLHMRDAFADAMIYLCNFAYNHSAFFCFKRNRIAVPQPTDRDDNLVLSHILQSVASMLNQESRFEAKYIEQDAAVYSLFCQRFCSAMEIWANMYEIDLEKATFYTWNKIVGKRDWKADAATGGGHTHEKHET